MPKWLSSLLIVIGFLALIVLAILPRSVEVTVTTNQLHDASSTSHRTVNHNGPVGLDGASETPAPDSEDDGDGDS